MEKEEEGGDGGGGGHHHHQYHLPYPPPLPLYNLELTVVSAQDLHPAGRSMQTYAVVWIDPAEKLRTRLDPAGHTDPTWNHKLSFRVDHRFLRSATAAATVEIYASRRRPLSDSLLGTSRLVISALRPSATPRFVAVQIRRPTSLRPQGILNFGVAISEAPVRGSMPLLLRQPSMARASLAAAASAKAFGRNGSASRMEIKLEKWKAELPAASEEESSEKKVRPTKSARVVAKKTGSFKGLGCFIGADP